MFVEPTWADRATATWSHFGTTLVFGALLTLPVFVLPALAAALGGITRGVLTTVIAYGTFGYLAAIWCALAPGAAWVFVLTQDPGPRIPVLIRAGIEPRAGTALTGRVQPRFREAAVFAALRVFVRLGTFALLMGVFMVPHFIFGLAGLAVPDIAMAFLFIASLGFALLSMGWPLRVMERGIAGTRLAYATGGARRATSRPRSP